MLRIDVSDMADSTSSSCNATVRSNFSIFTLRIGDYSFKGGLFFNFQFESRQNLGFIYENEILINISSVTISQ